MIVAFGSQVAIAPDLKTALDQIFGGRSGAETTETDGGKPSTSTPPKGGTSSPTALTDALTDAQKAFDDGEAALAKKDFAGYGKAQERLKEALERAAAAQGKAAAPVVTPAPSASPAASRSSGETGSAARSPKAVARTSTPKATPPAKAPKAPKDGAKPAGAAPPLA